MRADFGILSDGTTGLRRLAIWVRRREKEFKMLVGDSAAEGDCRQTYTGKNRRLNLVL